ncbi:hypothetical protein HHL08_22715 [Sphingobium sp. AR-3-1]|uniref:Uncharacterized protein n=1 Tax=Sphingobium psychrophilum TaxID=2728834 RepID=A0A7X9ZW05_9SPHN|nr:hypothetical protein [Sphingobium psychrophilum]NML12909.1 hypothetical protein [Sphingobium psychrophilum]
MVDNRFDDRVMVEKKGPGRTLVIALVAVVALVGVLFATGFWSADVKEGDLPEVSVNGGELPKVDVDSKAVVVGTKKEEIDVPTVGVKDNGEE